MNAYIFKTISRYINLCKQITNYVPIDDLLVKLIIK